MVPKITKEFSDKNNYGFPIIIIIKGTNLVSNYTSLQTDGKTYLIF